MMTPLRSSLLLVILRMAGLSLVFSSLTVSAQKIDLTLVELVDDKVVFHYNLDDKNPSHQYSVSIFSSKDAYTAPLAKVSGDVGNEVLPGNNKYIEWDISQELGRFVGSLEFQIKAKVFVPFLKLSQFDAKKNFKRGKSYPLVWASGNMSGQVDIELFEGQTRVASDRNVPNTGKFDWFIPSNVKPGRDYYIRFTNTKNRDEIIESVVFRITAKVPKVVKGLVLIAISGTAVIIGNLEGEVAQGDSELPGAPPVPTSK